VRAPCLPDSDELAAHAVIRFAATDTYGFTGAPLPDSETHSRIPARRHESRGSWRLRLDVSHFNRTVTDQMPGDIDRSRLPAGAFRERRDGHDIDRA